MKAIHIRWDIDYDDFGPLPTEIELPPKLTDEDEICNYLSDFTGYPVQGFDLIDN